MSLTTTFRRITDVVLCTMPLIGTPPEASFPGPVARGGEAWWASRHAHKLAEIHLAFPDLLVLGDSIVQELEHRGGVPADDFAGVWDRFYAPWRAVNLGFAGDTTANLLWRIEHGEVDGIRPRAALLLIGANDKRPEAHFGAATTVAGIEAILTALCSRLPHIKVLLVGLLPSGVGAAINSDVNHALASLPWDGTGITWLDAGDALRHGGQADPTMFLDPLREPSRPALHPTSEGWRRLAERIEPVLASVMEDRRSTP